MWHSKRQTHHQCIATKIFNILHIAKPRQHIYSQVLFRGGHEWWRLPADLEVPWNCWVWHFLLFDTEDDKYLYLVIQLCHERQRSVIVETTILFIVIHWKNTFFSSKEMGKKGLSWNPLSGKNFCVSPCNGCLGWFWQEI
jgi:hypothetical protein